MSAANRPLRRHLWGGALVVFTTTITACSTTTEVVPSGDNLTWEDSPLNQVLGLGHDDVWAEDYQQQNAELARRAEEVVAECMAVQGFDYVPTSSGTDIVIAEPADESLSDIEYAQLHGYGLTSLFLERQEMDAASSQQPTDPNEQAYRAMSESEQHAWNLALYGELYFLDESTATEDELNSATTGCWGKADEVVYAPNNDDNAWDAILNNPEFAEFLDAIDNLNKKVEKDPNMVALNSEWADCMADSGYPTFDRPIDAPNSLYGELDSMTRADGGEFRDLSQSELDDFLGKEIAIATADFTCQDELDYNDISLQIQFDAEQELIDSNQSTVDALTAELASSEKDS